MYEEVLWPHITMHQPRSMQTRQGSGQRRSYLERNLPLREAAARI